MHIVCMHIEKLLCTDGQWQKCNESFKTWWAVFLVEGNLRKKVVHLVSHNPLAFIKKKSFWNEAHFKKVVYSVFSKVGTVWCFINHCKHIKVKCMEAFRCMIMEIMFIHSSLEGWVWLINSWK